MFTLLDGFNLGLGIMVFVVSLIVASIVLALGFEVVVWLLKKLIGVIIGKQAEDLSPFREGDECRTPSRQQTTINPLGYI